MVIVFQAGFPSLGVGAHHQFSAYQGEGLKFKLISVCLNPELTRDDNHSKFVLLLLAEQ